MDLHGLRQHAVPPPVARLRWPSVHTQLSLLMFLLYAAPGAIVPLFSLRLKELGFSPAAIGWCCATQAIGSLLAPLIAGQIADRWFAAERCLSACAAAAAVLLWVIGEVTTPHAVFIGSLMFWLVMAPALTLATSVCFAHLPDARREFGRVRMWGTVGWVTPGWLFGFWLASGEQLPQIGINGAPGLADAFRLAAVLAVVFGIYSFTLPRTAPQRGIGVAPLKALRLLKGRAFGVYALCTLGVTATLAFSSQLSPLLMESLGVSRPWVPRLLTIAQGSEIVSLLLLPRVMGWLGIRGTMRLGLAAVVLTLSGLATGGPLALVLGGLALYGLCISCYLVAGQMFLHQHAAPDVRSSAQAMHSVLCGIGLLFGNVLVGQVRSLAGGDFRITLTVGAAMAMALFALFALTFPRERRA